MKKFLHPLFLLVLAILATSAQAQDFSATVSWNIPGSVKVLKGSSPNSGTAVTIPDDATSFMVTEAADYMFLPATDEYYVESAVMDGAAENLTSNWSTGSMYYKLQGQWHSDEYNGKIVELTMKKYEIVGQFTLDIKNGADKISFQLQDESGNTTATLTPADGENIYQLRNVDKKLYMRPSGYPVPALFTATNNNTDIAQEVNGSYLTDLTADATVVVALTDPAVEIKNYDVTIKFANNNPGCLNNIYKWTAPSAFIQPDELEAKNYKLTVEEGTELQFNINSTADYTLNSISASPEVTVVNEANHRYKITQSTTITIDATTNVIEDLTAQLYTNDITGIDFYAAYGDETPLETTAGTEHAAGTVTFSKVSYTIPVATTDYTIKGISGKTGRFFFNTKPGFYIKEGALGNIDKETGDDADYFKLNGSTSAIAADCPIYINVGKINYNTGAYFFYQGNAQCTARVTSGTADGDNAPYEGQANNVAEGYTRITFDPDYNATFSAQFMVASGADANYKYYAYADGTKVAASSDSESLFPGIVLKENSVLKLFYANVEPLAHTLTFTADAGATATLAYDNLFTITDFSKPLKNVGTVEYTLTPGDGCEVTVNGAVLAAPYKFTPTAADNQITIKKAAKKFAVSIDPADGATVKSFSGINMKINFAALEQSGIEMVAVEENFADYFTISDGTNTVAVLSADEATYDDVAGEYVFPFTLASPVTAAGEYTITVKEGLFYATKYDEATSSYVRVTDAPAVSDAATAKVTVDPDYRYKWSFDPENASQNPLPEGEDVMIYISLPEAKSLSPVAFYESEPVGPWLTYNDTPLKLIDENYEGDWEVGSDPQQWGKPVLRFIVNSSVFTKNGTLTVRAEEGAFTVNDSEASPAFEYSVRFGESKEYTVNITPEPSTTVDAAELHTITIEFAEAQTIAIEGFEGIFSQVTGAYLNEGNVTVEGNKATITIDPEFNITPGNWNLQIYEGSFLIDGKQPSAEITAGWTVERTSVSFNWEATPSIDIVNNGYGIEAGFFFDEDESVRVIDNTGIVVKFNDQVLGAMDYDNYETVAGVSINAGSSDYPNVLMISAGGGFLNDIETTGKLSVTIAAGAISVSGTPTTEEIAYTWNVVKKKDYTVTLTPADGTKITNAFDQITIEFTDAETAELFHKGSIQLQSSDYSYLETATSVEAVADAANPTFIVKFPEVKTNGTYRLSVREGAFTLDGAQTSPAVNAQYTVDISSGIVGIAADENGKYAVVTISGIVLLQNADAEAVNALPAGIYVINGVKTAKK